MMQYVISILFAAFTAASFSNFFDDCLQDGMIFEKWGKFIEGKFWLKPLGGCMICTNTWVNIIASIAIAIYAGITILEFLLLAVTLVSISNTFLKFIIK